MNWTGTLRASSTAHRLGGTLSNLAYVLAGGTWHSPPIDLEYANVLATRAIHEQRLALERPDEPNVFLLKHYFVLVLVEGRRGRVHDALAACEQALQVGEVLQSRYPENPEIPGVIAQIQQLKGTGEVELKKLSAPPQEQGADEQ